MLISTAFCGGVVLHVVAVEQKLILEPDDLGELPAFLLSGRPVGVPGESLHEVGHHLALVLKAEGVGHKFVDLVVAIHNDDDLVERFGHSAVNDVVMLADLFVVADHLLPKI